ncbi:hypothetical protein MUN74_16940 [Agromyces endophyticus]|uniref:DUF6993 domain-containing protein n=1 Tax=Agromyces sp. H17E-10 TaxID=2932244 RepID=UPI001FD2F1C7|nr:hypothetical protein [Agromyces sp. H17E-10]UOQ88931.1 hypothetical protein MUN74_16940 [Agromyces sp. H17E-10]
MARRIGTTAALALVTTATVLALAGCTFGGSTPPTASQSPSASVPASTAPAAPPTLRPELSAAENLEYFNSVNAAVVVANAEAHGRDFIDALVAAGFDKQAMQVTSDETTQGDPADSIQFAVLFQDECLVGQYGPKSGGYHGAVRPALGTGGCLIGQMRPIDW